MKYDYIILHTFPEPEKLALIQEVFEIVKWFGVREIDERVYIHIPSPSNPEKKIKVMVIRWDIAPQIKFIRESIEREIKVIN